MFQTTIIVRGLACPHHVGGNLLDLFAIGRFSYRDDPLQEDDAHQGPVFPVSRAAAGGFRVAVMERASNSSPGPRELVVF